MPDAAALRNARAAAHRCTALLIGSGPRTHATPFTSEASGIDPALILPSHGCSRLACARFMQYPHGLSPVYPLVQSQRSQLQRHSCNDVAPACTRHFSSLRWSKVVSRSILEGLVSRNLTLSSRSLSTRRLCKIPSRCEFFLLFGHRRPLSARRSLAAPLLSQHPVTMHVPRGLWSIDRSSCADA